MADTGRKPTRKYHNAAGKRTTAGEHSNMGMFDHGIVILDEKQALGYCPICFGIMSWDGATEDHIVTATQYFNGSLQELTEEEYNAETNLMTAHHRCNTYKGTTDIFEFWRSNPDKLKLSAEQYEALIAVLDYYHEGGVKSLLNVAPVKWRSTVFKIVRSIQNRDPEFVELSVRL